MVCHLFFTGSSCFCSSFTSYLLSPAIPCTQISAFVRYSLCSMPTLEALTLESGAYKTECSTYENKLNAAQTLFIILTRVFVLNGSITERKPKQ